MGNTAKTMNYGRFYALLQQLPGGDKADLVRQFTNGRTEHLHAMEGWEYANMLGAMERLARGDGERYAALDKARKRLIACIGGYLTATGRKNEIGVIKALACRASECKRFNDIPLDRLNSLYNAFLHRRKDLATVEALNLDAPVQELEAQLAKAIAAENYELAAKIQERIDEVIQNY
jgi:hypothetical protein